MVKDTSSREAEKQVSIVVGRVGLQGQSTDSQCGAPWYCRVFW
jgi:hypothetical protein